MSDAERIGIDLGGTKISGVRLAADGSVLAHWRVDTPQDDYDATIAAIAHLVGRLTRAGSGAPATVGIGTPGAPRLADGLMKNCNSTCLNGRALGADLTRAIGQTVRLANDADCFALSEAIDGAAARAPVVFGVILGTGVGGGLVVDQQLVSGPTRLSGEWGHIPLPGFRQHAHPVEDRLPDRACYCGASNCIETFLSGGGLAMTYRSFAGDELAAPQVVAAAASEPRAAAVMDCYEHMLARALALLINVLDPHVIVAGGGLSNVARLFDNVPTHLPRYVFGGEVQVQFRPAQFGDDSGVRGAAWLWQDGSRSGPR